jgi:hypothetical protein
LGLGDRWRGEGGPRAQCEPGRKNVPTLHQDRFAFGFGFSARPGRFAMWH